MAAPLDLGASDEEIRTRIQDQKESRDGLQLDLPKMGLLHIPRQVIALRKIRVLNLRANKITMLPTEICETLTDLEFLNLSFNRMQYLPENISSCIKLRTLLLNNNEISELPAGIGRLPLLTELRLGFNQLQTLPDTIGRLTSVKVLTLANNQLQTLPGSMVGMRSLESLDVSDNPDLDLETLPDYLYRLNEMYALLHKKEKRRKVITRALAIRPAVRQVVREELFDQSGGGETSD
jgi:Leucine-rich repeat (LRR) protein